MLWVQRPFSERAGRLKILTFSSETVDSGFTYRREDKYHQHSASQQVESTRVVEITKENQEIVHMKVVCFL